MGAIFHAAAHHGLGHPLQFLGTGFPAPLDGRLAGHGVEQLVPGGGGVGGAGGQQFQGDLLQGGGDILHRHMVRGLAHRQSAPQLVHVEAELLQQGQVGQQRLLLLRRQTAGHRSQQGLGHGVVALRLHPVEVHPLVGGVLVDEEHRLPLLHDDVGVQHLPGHPPGLLLGEGGGGGLLLMRAHAVRPPGHTPGRFFGEKGGGGFFLYRDRGRFRRQWTDDLRFCGRRRVPVGRGLAPAAAGNTGPDRIDGLFRLRRVHGQAHTVPHHGGRLLGDGARILHFVGGILDPDLGLGRRGRNGQPGLVGGNNVLANSAPLRLASAQHPLRCVARPFPNTAAALGCAGDPFLQFYGRVAPVLLQCGQDSVVHRRKHLPLIAELHLGFGGVDVHIHGVELCLQMEDTAREFPYHFLVAVGLFQRGHHDPGLDLAAIDEEKLPVPAAPAAGGEGDEAGHRHVLPGGLHRAEAQGQLPAQDGVDGGLELAVSGGEQLLLPVPNELHGDLRVGQGHPLDHGEDGGPLGGVLLHKLQPGGGVVKQVPDHHGGAQGTACLLHVPGDAPLQRQGGPQLCLGSPGHDLHPGDGGNGGQGLPPEAQGADGLQVIFGAQLAGGVAEKGGLYLAGGDAPAVVGDPEEGHPPVGDLHGDLGGPGVDGVLHQLLGHGGGPLHHLAGGDQVGHMGI